MAKESVSWKYPYEPPSTHFHLLIFYYKVYVKTEVPDIFYFVSIYHYIIDIIGQKSAAESISAMNHSHRGQRTPFCDIIRYKSFQAERGLLMAETFLILLDEALYGVVQISTTLLEFFGIAVLMATALKCFYLIVSIIFRKFIFTRRLTIVN